MTWRKKPQQINLDSIRNAVESAYKASLERIKRDVEKRDAEEREAQNTNEES